MQADAAAPGTYLLQLACEKPTRLSIGQLGDMSVEPGYYLYVGSAFGPGGVRARVGHHRRIAARAHWHIDYLRTVTVLGAAWCVYDVRCEHQWAQCLMHSRGATVPLAGFGASDCRCAAHLFRFGRRPVKTVLEKLLRNKLETLDL